MAHAGAGRARGDAGEAARAELPELPSQSRQGRCLRAHDRLGLLRYMEPGAGKLSIGKLPTGTAANAAGIVMESSTDPADVFAQKFMLAKCRAMVRAFRSHPSLIQYTLQNEIGADLKNPDTFVADPGHARGGPVAVGRAERRIYRRAARAAGMVRAVQRHHAPQRHRRSGAGGGTTTRARATSGTTSSTRSPTTSLICSRSRQRWWSSARWRAAPSRTTIR